MIIPGANATFYNFGPIYIICSVLDDSLFIGDYIFNISGHFIVKFVELRTVAADSEVLLHFIVCFWELASMQELIGYDIMWFPYTV